MSNESVLRGNPALLMRLTAHAVCRSQLRAFRDSVLKGDALPLQGEGFALQCGPVVNGCHEPSERRNKDGSHDLQVTLARAKRSTIYRPTDFLVGTAY